MTDRNIIQIKAGRHPLQELTVSAFVANDTNLVGGVGSEEETTSCPSLDSPATRHYGLTSAVQSQDRGRPKHGAHDWAELSGKSVYLKQVAIIVYMAHVGSFVPAEDAKIGTTDKILTCISTREERLSDPECLHDRFANKSQSL